MPSVNAIAIQNRQSRKTVFPVDSKVANRVDPNHFFSARAYYNVSRVVKARDDSTLMDTSVLPAHPEGFREYFLDQLRWLPVPPIRAELAGRLRYIAVYQATPISAITHYANIHSIKQLPNSEKMEITFTAPQKIGPLRYRKYGNVKPIQGRRYANMMKLREATSLDDAF